MNKYIKHTLEMAERAHQCILDRAFTPPIPRADALVTSLTGGITQLRDHGSGQVGGFGSYRAGATERHLKADALRDTLRSIRETAFTLNREAFPGLYQQFRMPHSNGYQALLDTARAFVDAVTPATIKAAFTERGYAATFDTDLTAQIDDVEAAVMRKHAGRQEQKAGTANLKLVAAETLRVVRELGAIVVATYRTSDPAFVEVWRAAARITRSSAPAPATPPPPGGDGSGSGSGTGEGSGTSA